MGIFAWVRRLLKNGRRPPAPPERPRQPFEIPGPDTPAAVDAKGNRLCPVCKLGLARLPYGYCLPCTEKWNDFMDAWKDYQK